MAETFNPNQTVENAAVNTDQSYNNAISSRNTGQLLDIAKTNPNTPIADAAINAVQHITSKAKEFASIVAPIEKAGGPGTPEGNIAVANTWKTAKDNPQWGTALISYLMGDKQNALNLVTGGKTEQKITYDKNGTSYRKTVNALGETVNVIDQQTGMPISPKDYDTLGIGYSSYADTQAAQLEKADKEANRAALKESQVKNNSWSALTDVHAPMFQEIYNNLGKIKSDLTPEQYADIFSKVNSSIGSAAAQSSNKSLLSQFNNGIGFKAGEQVSKQVAASMGLEGVWSFNGKGGVTNDKGESKSFSELEQKQNTNNVSAENTKRFDQTQESAMKYAKINGLSDQATTRLLRTIQLSHQIGQDQLELTNKVGKPMIVSLPGAFNIEDKQGQGRAQALQGMYNNEVMQAYRDWSNKEMVNYNKLKAIPDPAVLEANFVKSPQYQELKNKYAQQIQGVYNESFVKPQPAAPAKPAAVAPPPVTAPAATNAVQGAAKPKRSLADIYNSVR